MSADNWAICPRCRDTAQAEHDERLAAAMALYGVVPLAEFEAARAAADTPFDEEQFRTFREDYEFWGVATGTLTVDYLGACGKRGLQFHINGQKHVFYTPTGGTS